MTSTKFIKLEARLHDLHNRGFIHRSISPWGSTLLFVTKKNNSLCICIDFIELNKVTVMNSYPFVRIDDVFDQLCIT